MNRTRIFGILTLLGLSLMLLGCTADQLGKASAEAGVIHSITTQPAVQITATALDPVTGGLSSTILALLTLGSSLTANALQRSSNTKLLAHNASLSERLAALQVLAGDPSAPLHPTLQVSQLSPTVALTDPPSSPLTAAGVPKT